MTTSSASSASTRRNCTASRESPAGEMQTGDCILAHCLLVGLVGAAHSVRCALPVRIAIPYFAARVYPLIVPLAVSVNGVCLSQPIPSLPPLATYGVPHLKEIQNQRCHSCRLPNPKLFACHAAADGRSPIAAQESPAHHYPMPDKRKKLCGLCRSARDDRMAHAPGHVVHPVPGEPRLYDVNGLAKCPDCGAVWLRRRNESVLV